MKNDFLTLLTLVAGMAISSGCGTGANPMASLSSTPVNVDASQYQLADEPDGAVGVIDARESAEDGAPLVLIGRIGGCEKPWVEGRAAFTLLDASISVVAEGEVSEEGEICKADCCANERLGCTTLVKVVDPRGQIVPVDSRELFDLKESDMVVVQGTAKKDNSGNFVMLAKGIFVRK